MTHQPGDSFDVYRPNRDGEVEDMLHRLGLQDQRNHRVLISLLKDTKKRGKGQRVFRTCRRLLKMPFNVLVSNVVGAQVPPYIPHNASLLYLLTWCLEIRSVPKKVCESVGKQYTSSINTRFGYCSLDSGVSTQHHYRIM